MASDMANQRRLLTDDNNKPPASCHLRVGTAIRSASRSTPMKRPSEGNSARPEQPALGRLSWRLRREWNERYGDYIAQANNWRLIAIAALGVAAVAVAGNVWQSVAKSRAALRGRGQQARGRPRHSACRRGLADSRSASSARSSPAIFRTCARCPSTSKRSGPSSMKPMRWWTRTAASLTFLNEHFRGKRPL